MASFIKITEKLFKKFPLSLSQDSANIEFTNTFWGFSYDASALYFGTPTSDNARKVAYKKCKWTTEEGDFSEEENYCLKRNNICFKQVMMKQRPEGEEVKTISLSYLIGAYNAYIKRIDDAYKAEAEAYLNEHPLATQSELNKDVKRETPTYFFPKAEFGFDFQRFKDFASIVLLFTDGQNMKIKYSDASKAFWAEGENWFAVIMPATPTSVSVEKFVVERGTPSLKLGKFSSKAKAMQNSIKHGEIDMFSFTGADPCRKTINCVAVSKDNKIKLATDNFIMVANADLRTLGEFDTIDWQLVPKEGETPEGRFPNVCKCVKSLDKAKACYDLQPFLFNSDLSYFEEAQKWAKEIDKSANVSSAICQLTLEKVFLAQYKVKKIRLFLKNGIKTAQYYDFDNYGYIVLTDAYGGFLLCITDNVEKIKDGKNLQEWFSALRKGEGFSDTPIIKRKPREREADYYKVAI